MFSFFYLGVGCRRFCLLVCVQETETYIIYIFDFVYLLLISCLMSICLVGWWDFVNQTAGRELLIGKFCSFSFMHQEGKYILMFSVCNIAGTLEGGLLWKFSPNCPSSGLFVSRHHGINNLICPGNIYLSQSFAHCYVNSPIPWQHGESDQVKYGGFVSSSQNNIIHIRVKVAPLRFMAIWARFSTFNLWRETVSILAYCNV